MSKTLCVGFIVILLAIVGIFCLNKRGENMEKEATYKSVSMDEIVKIMNENEGYILLDVRTEEEFKDGHIPGAICIPNETIFNDVINKLPDKDQLILIYCRSGNRSKQAATKLQKLGYTNLIEFGGIVDWTGEVVK